MGLVVFILASFSLFIIAHAASHDWHYMDHNENMVTYECSKCGEVKKEEI